MNNIIETHGLSKAFGDTVAVDHVTIHVRPGEIYGFLGLNGAGKTTTIRLLLGMIKADSGNVSLFGQRVQQASPVWNDVGYLVEAPFSYPDLTVTENLKVVHRLRGLQDKNLISNIIDKLKLTAYQHKKARHLSTGNNQRLGLAKALMHHPRLLILDEPINGLDPAGIVEIREYLKDMVREHNTTIFLSSHILSEIARLATRIGIVHQGKLIKELNADELEQQLIKKLRINTTDNRKALLQLQRDGYVVSQSPNGLLELGDPISIENPDRIASLLVHTGVPPKLLQVQEEDLESYFLRVIREKD